MGNVTRELVIICGTGAVLNDPVEFPVVPWQIPRSLHRLTHTGLDQPCKREMLGSVGPMAEERLFFRDGTGLAIRAMRCWVGRRARFGHAPDKVVTGNVVAGVEAEEIHSHPFQFFGAILGERFPRFVFTAAATFLAYEKRKTRIRRKGLDTSI